MSIEENPMGCDHSTAQHSCDVVSWLVGWLADRLDDDDDEDEDDSQTQWAKRGQSSGKTANRGPLRNQQPAGSLKGS